MKFDGPFAPGASMRGAIVPTTVDAEVGKAQKPYEGMPVEIAIEQMEPERLFSFRCIPSPLRAASTTPHEPTTLIVFALETQRTASC